MYLKKKKEPNFSRLTPDTTGTTASAALAHGIYFFQTGSKGKRKNNLGNGVYFSITNHQGKKEKPVLHGKFCLYCDHFNKYQLHPTRRTRILKGLCHKMYES